MIKTSIHIFIIVINGAFEFFYFKYYSCFQINLKKLYIQLETHQFGYAQSENFPIKSYYKTSR